MKKALVCLLVLLFSSIAYAGPLNLFEKFKNDPEITTYLEEVINEAANPDVKIEIFKEIFEEVIEKRINKKFTLVTSKDEADIIVKAKILKYDFTKKALPMPMSSASLIGDTIEPKSSAILTVDYEVFKASSGESIFHKEFVTEARKPMKYMENENGFKYAVRASVNRFLFKTFYKEVVQPEGALNFVK